MAEALRAGGSSPSVQAGTRFLLRPAVAGLRRTGLRVLACLTPWAWVLRSSPAATTCPTKALRRRKALRSREPAPFETYAAEARPYRITVTGVPTSTLSKKTSAILPGIRMQPCEAG